MPIWHHMFCIRLKRALWRVYKDLRTFTQCHSQAFSEFCLGLQNWWVRMLVRCQMLVVLLDSVLFLILFFDGSSRKCSSLSLIWNFGLMFLLLPVLCLDCWKLNRFVRVWGDLFFFMFVLLLSICYFFATAALMSLSSCSCFVVWDHGVYVSGQGMSSIVSL